MILLIFITDQAINLSVNQISTLVNSHSVCLSLSLTPIPIPLPQGPSKGKQIVVSRIVRKVWFRLKRTTKSEFACVRIIVG